MQGQRSTVHSFLEAFEFDNGTSTGSDQQIYWNNLTNPGDTRNLRDYLLSSGDPVNLPFVDPTAHSGSSLNSRSLGINLGQQSVNHPNHDDVKMDEDWTSSLSIHPGASSSLEPRRLEQSEIPPLGSININLHNGLPNMPLHHQNSCPSSALQSSESLTGYVGTDIQPLIDGTSGSNQYKPLASVTGQMLSAGSSSDPGGSSSAMMSDFLDDNGSRSGCSMDGRRFSCKRKNFETVSGQSSLGGSSSFQRVEDNIRQILPSRHNSALSIAVPPQNPSSAQSLGEQLHPLVSGSSSRLALDCHSSLPVGSDAESSQRNFRMRMNPTYPQESTSSPIWPAANSARRNGWQPHSSTDRIFSPNRSLDSRSLISSTGSSHNQSNASHLPGFHQYLQSSRWNGVSIPRIGSSSSSHVASGERSTDLREDARPRTLPRSVPDHLMLPPPLETRHHAQDPASWSQSSRNLPTDTSSASIAASSSGPSSSGASWTPGPVAFAHLHRRLSEGRRSRVPWTSSVEELLALEERIGNVSTGLNEETIMKCLKQSKYNSSANHPSVDAEPCCICQEEYVDEEDLGTLDCGHNFHAGCVKQWLMHKNLCPICKTTALVTP
ncbi:putative E3 ubiquitin-protein ligase [Nymphaea thermarum]|nr:putative E3 ubiquitin-protein ligase [Nymphaea thermarum]